MFPIQVKFLFQRQSYTPNLNNLQGRVAVIYNHSALIVRATRKGFFYRTLDLISRVYSDEIQYYPEFPLKLPDNILQLLQIPKEYADDIAWIIHLAKNRVHTYETLIIQSPYFKNMYEKVTTITPQINIRL